MQRNLIPSTLQRSYVTAIRPLTQSSVPICISCITEKHNGHNFSKITVKLSEKRDKMLEETKTLRDQTVGQWEEVLKQAQKITAEYIANIDQIDTELKERAKDMHEQVNIILAQSQKSLQQMKTSGLDTLKNQEKYLSDKIEQLKAEVQRYEDCLLEADSNALLQFKSGTIQPKEEQPSLETESIPNLSFTKGQDDQNAMQKMFGHISTEGINVSHKSFPSPSSTQATSTSDFEKTMVPSPQPSPSSATQRSLIPTPSVSSQFYVRNDFPPIACVEGGLAWVETEANKLQLVDRNGAVKDTINIDFNFYDMAVTSDGDLLLPDYKNRCIKSVSKQKDITTMFKTSGRPNSLCCLQNNDIVVAFDKDRKVVVYSSKGKIRHTLDQIKFRYPMKVAVNKVNQDLYICDHEEDDAYFPGKVIAVGADGHLRYEYLGQGEMNFTPVEVCTDQMGHILITDRNNNRVHILDQEGQFIKYILTSEQGMRLPNSIDTDGEGYIWVGKWECVKVSQYLQ